MLQDFYKVGPAAKREFDDIGLRASSAIAPHGRENRQSGIKVTDNLQDPMCIAAAVRKEDTRVFVGHQLQA